MRVSGVFNNGKLAGSGKKAESLGAYGAAAFLAMGSLPGAGRKLNPSAHAVRRRF